MTGTYKTPGQLIHALLEERGWSQRVLAVVLDMHESGVNKLVSDRQPVTAEIALLLEEVFKVPAENFLTLQKEFDLADARFKSRPDPSRSTRAVLYGDLPVAEMIARGWIAAKGVRDTQAVELGLAKFFGVDSISDIEILPHAAKKTQVSHPATPAQMAWLYRVKQIASEMLVPRYSEATTRAALPKLRALLSAAEEARRAPRILAECGIRFVIVESLPGAKIDGVCFWLNDFSPVIGISMRFDRIDNFWFVLRHELEHVLQGHGKSAVMLDVVEMESTNHAIPDEERIANEAASEFCVPKAKMESFIARKAPFFAERDILGMANTLRIHPGLIAGQLQHRTNRYDRFKDHIVKIRAVVSPSAVVDGWGDVAPIGN